MENIVETKQKHDIKIVCNIVAELEQWSQFNPPLLEPRV